MRGLFVINGIFLYQHLEGIKTVCSIDSKFMGRGDSPHVFTDFMKRFKYIKNVHENCTFCGDHVFKEYYSYTTIITEMNVINCKKCFIREFGKKFEKTVRKENNESSKDETRF